MVKIAYFSTSYLINLIMNYNPYKYTHKNGYQGKQTQGNN